MATDALKAARKAQSSGFSTDWDKQAAKHKSMPSGTMRSGHSNNLGHSGHPEKAPIIAKRSRKGGY